MYKELHKITLGIGLAKSLATRDLVGGLSLEDLDIPEEETEFDDNQAGRDDEESGGAVVLDDEPDHEDGGDQEQDGGDHRVDTLLERDSVGRRGTGGLTRPQAAMLTTLRMRRTMLMMTQTKFSPEEKPTRPSPKQERPPYLKKGAIRGGRRRRRLTTGSREGSR